MNFKKTMSHTPAVQRNIVQLQFVKQINHRMEVRSVLTDSYESLELVEFVNKVNQ